MNEDSSVLLRLFPVAMIISVTVVSILAIMSVYNMPPTVSYSYVNVRVTDKTIETKYEIGTPIDNMGVVTFIGGGTQTDYYLWFNGGEKYKVGKEIYDYAKAGMSATKTIGYDNDGKKVLVDYKLNKTR